MTTETQPAALRLSEGLGPLPPQREGQYLTMTICGTNDDPAECGHWSSPQHVQWRIEKAIVAERERLLSMPNLMHACDLLGCPADGTHCDILRRALYRA